MKFKSSMKWWVIQYSIREMSEASVLCSKLSCEQPRDTKIFLETQKTDVNTEIFQSRIRICGTSVI